MLVSAHTPITHLNVARIWLELFARPLYLQVRLWSCKLKSLNRESLDVTRILCWSGEGSMPLILLPYEKEHSGVRIVFRNALRREVGERERPGSGEDTPFCPA